MAISFSSLDPVLQESIQQAQAENATKSSPSSGKTPMSSLHPDTQQDIRVATGNHNHDDLHKVAMAAAQQFGIDPDVFIRQIQQESGFNPKAKSKAGAIGIAQIMPGTAKSWGVDPNDPVASLRAAAKNMAAYKSTYERQGHDPGTATAMALAAYNAGPGAVAKHGGVPPYAETQHYVRTIMGGGHAPIKPTGAPAGAGNNRPAITGALLPSDTRNIGNPFYFDAAGTHITPQAPQPDVAGMVKNAVQQVNNSTPTVAANAKPIVPVAPPSPVYTTAELKNLLPQPAPTTALAPQGTNFFGDLVNSTINHGSAGLLDLPHGNGWGNSIGGFLGPAIGTIGAGFLAPETGGASLAIPAAYMGLAGAGNTAREQFNRTGRIDNPLAVASSGAINAGLGLIPGAGRAGAGILERMLLNGGKDAAINAGADYLQQGAEQHTLTPALDMARLRNSALLGAGLGAGFGAMHGKPAEAATDVAEGVPEITHNGAAINSEEDLKQALNQEYNRQKLAKSVETIDKGAQPIGHGDMLKDLDAQLQSKLAKVPDSLGPKSETALPDIMPTSKSAAESASVLDEHAQNIEAAHSLAEDATQARKAAEQELAQATGIHDDPVAAQRALGQRVLEADKVRQFQRTPEMQADKDLLNRVLETRQQELEAHALLDSEQAPTRRSELPNPEPIGNRLPAKPMDMLDFLTAPGEHPKELPSNDMMHSVGMSLDKSAPLERPFSSPAHTPIDTHQSPESVNGQPSVASTGSGTAGEQFNPVKPLNAEMRQAMEAKGMTPMHIADAMGFVRKHQPENMPHLLTGLEAGKNNQTFMMDHAPLEEGGRVINTREVSPVGLVKQTIKPQTEVANLRKEYGTDLGAIRDNLVQRLNKNGIKVSAAEQRVDGNSKTAVANLNKLAARLPEHERTHIYFMDHNQGATAREGTYGFRRLDRITNSSMTGKTQHLPEGEIYQNQIPAAYKALREMIARPDAPQALKRVTKQLDNGNITKGSQKALADAYREFQALKPEEWARFCKGLGL